ncbi:hypothetical protein ACFSX5_14200 [Devosia albogilva]|uniref:DUF3606 domain-containing protein n=1 Tax=Devosia albogilva TaxID=429726 RepID=A0ABW5QMM8_9HYPH
MAGKANDTDSKNVEFLSEEFGVPPEKAADLVTEDSEKAEKLATEQLEREHESDALEDLPVPEDPDHEWLGQSDSHMQKPVLREDRKPRDR